MTDKMSKDKVVDFASRRAKLAPDREHAKREAKAMELREAFNAARKSAQSKSANAEKLKKLFQKKSKK